MSIISGLLSAEQLEQLTKLTSLLSKEQQLWVSGYLAGLGAQQGGNALAQPVSAAASSQDSLTILYGSRTGNGEGLAKKALRLAEERGLKAVLKNMETFKIRDLQTEKNVLVIVSTHGDGVPPFSAQELHEYIYGKRAPKLATTNFAVLALGDSSYFQFCKTGKDFDEQLEKLGANRIAPILTCDLDFEEPAEVWFNSTLAVFAEKLGTSANAVGTQSSVSAGIGSEVVKYSKKNPFKAPIFDRVSLHGKADERQTIHLELATDDAGLSYEPGDSAAIIPLNTKKIIEEVLQATGLDAQEEVTVNGINKTLYSALRRDLELSKITTDVVKRFLELAPNA
ncbi:MAG: flavodoxin domain-containing protein [Bacteroidia bacterium]|nr:flavodoxin domain-containing protein [Bacteroidia bacterium]